MQNVTKVEKEEVLNVPMMRVINTKSNVAPEDLLSQLLVEGSEIPEEMFPPYRNYNYPVRVTSYLDYLVKSSKKTTELQEQFKNQIKEWFKEGDILLVPAGTGGLDEGILMHLISTAKSELIGEDDSSKCSIIYWYEKNDKSRLLEEFKYVVGALMTIEVDDYQLVLELEQEELEGLLNGQDDLQSDQ